MAPSVVDRKETKGRHGIKNSKGKMHHVACKNILHYTIPERYGEILLNVEMTMRKISWEGINRKYFYTRIDTSKR